MSKMPICTSFADASFAWTDKENRKNPASLGSCSSSNYSAEDNSMDDLVATLNRKLQLKSPSCFAKCKQYRSTAAPYSLKRSQSKSLIYRSTSFDSDPNQRVTRSNFREELTGDLLKEGKLIREAVKRLHLRTKSVSDIPDNSNYFNCDKKSLEYEYKE
ncbi:hypothetical protein HDE_11942 [Halotydeus destructor]|nr:hypothetical protein HDE_11942 [Halotydeus destructor]